MSRRLFIGEQEINFFNWIGKELIQGIVGQKIFYYAVAEQDTTADSLYGEAMQKTTFTPVEINALVRYNEPEQTMTTFSVDTVSSIEIYFLLHELSERGVNPKIGDFCKYGRDFYEVTHMTMPQTTYGQIDHKVQVRARCRIAREGQFRVQNIEGLNEP